MFNFEVVFVLFYFLKESKSFIWYYVGRLALYRNYSLLNELFEKIFPGNLTLLFVLFISYKTTGIFMLFYVFNSEVVLVLFYFLKESNSFIWYYVGRLALYRNYSLLHELFGKVFPVNLTLLFVLFISYKTTGIFMLFYVFNSEVVLVLFYFLKESNSFIWYYVGRLALYRNYSLLHELFGKVFPVNLTLLFVVFISYITTGLFLSYKNKKLFERSRSVSRKGCRLNTFKL